MYIKKQTESLVTMYEQDLQVLRKCLIFTFNYINKENRSIEKTMLESDKNKIQELIEIIEDGLIDKFYYDQENITK